MSSQLVLKSTVTTNMFRESSSSTNFVARSSNSLLEKWKLIRLRSELLTTLASLNPTEDAALSKASILSLLKASTLEAVQAFTLETEQNSFKDFIKPANIDSSFEAEGYKVTRDRLIALLREEDEDECKPTPHAFDAAWRLITDATRQLQKGFPKASVAADDEGGIRLRWRSLDKTREVSLYCPSLASEKAYIYHEVGDEYDADYKVSGLALANWLSWLTKNE